jgi:transcriptional regulator with XRE-family HTH domain
MAVSHTPGERITELCKTYSVTRETLAERSGVSIELIRKIEEEALIPDLAPLIKIAELDDDEDDERGTIREQLSRLKSTYANDDAEGLTAFEQRMRIVLDNLEQSYRQKERL